jgi:hypothetical protein
MNVGVAGQTSFLAQHHRRPTAKQDGMAAWLREQIEYLETIELTPYGAGSLSAYKSVLEEFLTIPSLELLP